MINYTEIIEHNLTGNFTINPALGLPTYTVNPNYTLMFLLNSIILGILLKKYNERLADKMQIKNKHLSRLLSTEFLIDMLHWGNMFFLIYNLWLTYIPIPDPVFI